MLVLLRKLYVVGLFRVMNDYLVLDADLFELTG